jgi:hypothetical protein
MIDDLSDTFGWSRKHTIKALNGQVSLGNEAGKRGRKASYGEEEKDVIVEIWKHSEQPCGKRLKATLPIWLESYEKIHGELTPETRTKITTCSARQLDRITSPHKVSGMGWRGRRTGRTSHRLKTVVPVKCGPWDVDEPGHMEADTVAHGGGSSSGQFMNSLTLTDIQTGWTELAALWGQTGGEVCKGLKNIEFRLPFPLLTFDCDNGSEFLNTTLEYYLLSRERKINWTRSRPYKKNDQAHVEQKNFTHVRQLLGYSRYDDIDLVVLVNDLYENAWLPLRNYFTPVMKLVEKQREGSRVKKKYDAPKTPCDRLLENNKTSEETKTQLRETRSNLDPFELAKQVEAKLETIYKKVAAMDAERAEEEAEEEMEVLEAPVNSGSVAAAVAPAPSAATLPELTEKLAKQGKKNQNQNRTRVS